MQNSNVFETGLSDFHKLTFAVLKAYFQKQKPQVISYRSYKKFDNNYYQKTFKPKILIHLRLLLSMYLTGMHH